MGRLNRVGKIRIDRTNSLESGQFIPHVTLRIVDQIVHTFRWQCLLQTLSSDVSQYVRTYYTSRCALLL